MPSGMRRYLQRWDDLILFIFDVLQPVGAELDLGWRIRYWLRQAARRR